MSQTKLLFTWESQYQVQEALSFWKKEFTKKYGQSWVHTFYSDQIDREAIQWSLMWSWFFSEKSLTVIYGLPKDNTSTNKMASADAEWVESFLMKHREEIPSSNILILVSYKPDKRTKSWKYFSTHASIKNFPKKKGKDLVLFVLGKCVNQSEEWIKQSLLTNTQAEYIVHTVWNDLYKLHYECDKVTQYCAYHKKNTVEDDLLSSLICSHADHDSFKILDAMWTDPTKAVKLIEEAQENQQNEYEFLWMLFRWLKLILWMLDLQAKWISSSKEMASVLKIHPFAVAKNKNKLELYKTNIDWITHLYKELLNLDYSIKTWRYPSEWFWVRIKSLIFKLHNQ